MDVPWNPEQYLTWGDERGRPFHDLMARVGARDPRVVVDLGCGPGNLTATLARRWPGARVSGVDSSAEMIRAAQGADGGADVEWSVADLRDWVAAAAPGSVDVLVSNATLQWVPDHLDLVPALLATVRPGGWAAWQVPGNFEAPSHALLRDLAADPRWADRLGQVHRPAAPDAASYLQLVRAAGHRVDAWETTYLHVLTGPDPVFTWVAATGARTTLEALDAHWRPIFEREYRDLLDQAYPPASDGTVVLPFRRVFVVVQVADAVSVAPSPTAEGEGR